MIDRNVLKNYFDLEAEAARKPLKVALASLKTIV